MPVRKHSILLFSHPVSVRMALQAPNQCFRQEEPLKIQIFLEYL